MGVVRKYALKIVIDIEARDDLEARRKAAGILAGAMAGVSGKREAILHSIDDRKSIRLSPEGEFAGQWNKRG
ncbi:MAG: hypothetical protein N3A38_01795 [Planctomycetota bacterium]|nr:hypothetical protein [Planctomycetota bacterium]